MGLIDFFKRSDKSDDKTKEGTAGHTAAHSSNVSGRKSADGAGDTMAGVTAAHALNAGGRMSEVGAGDTMSGYAAAHSSKSDNRKKGGRGEELACKYLKRLGYKVLARNWRNPFGEVDIVAAKDGVVAFIEVKTRLSDMFGQPSEAVDFSRRRRYINAALCWFSGREMDCTVRFDVIEVRGNKINHIVSAFEA